MGGVLCCNTKRKDDSHIPKTVCFMDKNGNVVREFDHVLVATTPRSRHIAFDNHVPLDNECLLLPSSSLPNRLRTIHANRVCSEITVLFCCSQDSNKQIFSVQEQHCLSRHNPSVMPNKEGDLIVQCGPIFQHIHTVSISTE